MKNNRKFVYFRDTTKNISFSFAAQAQYDEENSVAEFYCLMSPLLRNMILDHIDDYEFHIGSAKYPILYTSKEITCDDSLIVGVKLNHEDWDDLKREPPTSPQNQICAAAGAAPDPQQERTPLGYIHDIGSINGFNI